MVQPLVASDRDRAEERHEIVELCRRLDGLPLAIELAAARTKVLPVPEIATRLQDRFRLLRRAPSKHDGAPRHAGLQAAIDWSYDLLFESEQRMIRRMAIFSGGATIEAAERLCGDDAFDVASRLVDRSLLVVDTSGRIARFDMLESLRDYGIDRLADAGELAAVRADHLRWCIELAEQVDAALRGPDQLAWLDRLEAEHDNITAALGRAVVDDPAGALRLVGAVILPWWFRGRRLEIRQWAAASLAAGIGESPALRARVLAYVGLVAEPASSSIAREAETSRRRHRAWRRVDRRRGTSTPGHLDQPCR